jgi:hypothetical protein
MMADTGSPLAKRIERTGHTPDQFAGVSKEGCVAWATINMPLDERRQESIKFVSKHSRAGAKELAKDSDASDSRKSTLMDLSDLVSEVADDVANTSEFNGCLRIWSNNGGTLTSIGAVRVSDTSAIIEFLQKLKGQDTEGRTVNLKVAHVDGVDIHEVASAQSHKDYPELFDDKGAVYIGTGEKAVWYALGKGGLDRLKESISEARKGSTKSGPGELEARLLPLAEVWNKIHARRDTHAKSATVEKIKDKVRENRPKAAHAASIVRDLNLSKLAVDAFQKGHDTLSMRLSAEGQTLKVAGQLDEGVLRFIGNALSQFVKDNLEN